MGDDWLPQLLWGILIAMIELLAVGFGYLYHKDRDRRKMMFALAFTLSGIAYVRNVQPAWTSIEMVKRSYEWAFLPIASAVFIAVLCSLLRLKDFSKPFKAFLFILTISILMIFVPLPVAPDLFLWFDAIGSIIVSVYLILLRKQIPELMFLLSIGCNILAGVGVAQGLAPEFNILGSFLAYVFIALVFAIPNEIAEGSVGSFFALEKELKSEKGKFERLFTNNPEPAVYMDSDFHILDINPQFTKLFGFSLDEVKGKHIDDVVVPKGKTEEAKMLGREFMKGYASLDTVRKKKDGTLVPVSISGAPIIVDDQLVGTVGLYKDVTERKQMEKKLKEYSENLEELVEKRTEELKKAQERLLKTERLAAIGELAGMVGHDLRNPLQSIKNATSCLKIELSSNLNSEIQRVLKIMDNSIEYSNNIIRDLLDYSREMRLELARTTPKLITKKALSLVEVPENIRVLDSVRDESEINVDLNKMVRVFINITKNAIEAMPKGGTLAITSKKSNSNLEIAFADTGTGMTREVMEKLWTPLHTTRANGIGFGLPICKRVVEAHGGCINVKSKVEKGTTFIVTLPIKSGAKESEEVMNEAEPTSLTASL
jgi:PAS domain S-box-containing protein